MSDILSPLSPVWGSSNGLPFPTIALILWGAFLGGIVNLLVKFFAGPSSIPFRSIINVLLFALGVPFLYYWEVVCGASSFNADSFPGWSVQSPGFDGEITLQIRFAIHLFLLVVMASVSLIDFEHYVIPDGLMIPATVVGVLLMTLFPMAALPDYGFNPTLGIISPHPLLAFHGWTEGENNSFGFVMTTLCVLFWIVALLDRRWFSRLGFKRAGLLFLRRLKESRLSILLPLIGLAGISGVWLLYRLPSFPSQTAMKEALLSAVVGMVAGMVIIWGVRILGNLVLRREAMGFGDVVLMGFLGVFVGWQGAILLFFLAPFAGLVFGLLRALFRSEREIPYGPFLCLATLVLILFWPPLLNQVQEFLDGPTITIVLIFMGGLMVLLLYAIQRLKTLFRKNFR